MTNYKKNKKATMNKSNKFRLENSVWILNDDQDCITTWMLGQLERLVKKLCGSAPRFSMQLKNTFCIVAGSPKSNRFIRQAAQQKLINLDLPGQDDFLLKQTALDGSAIALSPAMTWRISLQKIKVIAANFYYVLLNSLDNYKNNNYNQH